MILILLEQMLGQRPGMRRQTKRIFLLLTSLTALVFAGVVLAILWVAFDSPFDKSDFDRAIWLGMAEDMDPDNARGGMAAALIEELESDKPSRAAVLQLLGPSEYPCSALSPPVGPTDKCLSYNLGMWSGMRLDYDTLDVYFNGEDRVTRVLTVQH
jgi:hypothetical protein